MEVAKKFSPSNLEHLRICPGWVPEKNDRNRDAADEGQMLHKSVETGRMKGLNQEQQECVMKVRVIFHTLVKKAGEGATVRREVWCRIQDYNRGIIDLFAISKNQKLAVVGDAKFGRIEVSDAEENLQGICYAVAIFEQYPAVEDIEVWFVQPRRDMVTHAAFKRADYEGLLMKIKLIRARVDSFGETQDVNMLRPQEGNCAWCGNLGVCPAVGTKALAIAHAYDLAHDHELPDLFHPSQLSTPENRAKAEKFRKVLEVWCSSVQKHNLQFRLDGNEIPGYELVTRAGDRSITAPRKAFEIAQTLTGGKLTTEDLLHCCNMSAAKLDEVVAAYAPKRGKGKMIVALRDALIDGDALSIGGESRFLQRAKFTDPKEITNDNKS